MGPRGSAGPPGSPVRLFLVFYHTLQNIVDLLEQINSQFFLDSYLFDFLFSSLKWTINLLWSITHAASDI